MRDFVFGSAAEIAEVVFYALVATGLTVLGALTELAASNSFSTGQTTLGAWELGFGAILLYAGFRVITEFVVPRARDVRAA